MTAVHLAYPEKWQLCPVPDTNEAPSSCVAVFFAAEKAFISARAGSIRRIFGGEEIVSHFCFVVLPCLALPCLALPCLALPCLGWPGLAVQLLGSSFFGILWPRDTDGRGAHSCCGVDVASLRW